MQYGSGPSTDNHVELSRRTVIGMEVDDCQEILNKGKKLVYIFKTNASGTVLDEAVNSAAKNLMSNIFMMCGRDQNQINFAFDGIKDRAVQLGMLVVTYKQDDEFFTKLGAAETLCPR